MSIRYTILGFLDWKPMTGYEIKKRMQQSPFFHWSGNNNQIYKALNELKAETLVGGELSHQSGGPAKKVYTITEAGREVLQQWLSQSIPSLPEIRKDIVLQLAWGELLPNEEIMRILDDYQSRIQDYLALYREQQRRQVDFPNRSEREEYIWIMLYDNMLQSCEQEYKWAETFKKGLKKHDD